jgi:SHOCT-like protein
MTAINDDVRRILDLLAQGKISVDDAHRLIAALGPRSDAAPADAAAAPPPRYLKIAVHKPANEHRPGDEGKDVKIRVPLAIVRGGMRLGAIIPGLGGDRMQARLREQGIDLDLSKLDPAAIETMLKELGELNIDIDSGKAQVRITCE